jgi:hypothetical protein
MTLNSVQLAGMVGKQSVFGISHMYKFCIQICSGAHSATMGTGGSFLRG